MRNNLTQIASHFLLPCLATGMMLLAGGAMLLLFTRSAVAADVNADAAAKVATQLCSNCHGPGGVSIAPTFPRLAGQQEMYLSAQLRAFKSKARADPEAHDYMWGMATLVSDGMIDGLAHYYASQPPAPGILGDTKLVAQGKRLFEEGIPERNIAACASCHGKDAEGVSVFPRLAGQHSAYVVRQLEVIQKQLRASPVMHGIIKELKPEEMKAVAVFVQSK